MAALRRAGADEKRSTWNRNIRWKSARRSPDASAKSGLWNRKKKLSRYEMRMIVPSLHYVTKCAVDDTGAFALNGFDFPRQHALRAAARGGAGSMPEATVKGRARFVSRGGDAAPRACAGAEEALPRPGPVLHRAARTDRHAEHPHRHGVCHASQTPRIHTARASAGRTHVDGRADQGGRGRNHSRLHRKDAGNVRSRTASVISRIPPRFMVDGRLEETVGEMNPVRAFRSTGMGRNHKNANTSPSDS